MPTDKTPLQKATIGLFFLFTMLAVAAVDIFAKENGARATISQGWLTINLKFWPLTYILAILMGILLQHVSIARDPGMPDDPAFSVRQMLFWTPFFWLGMYLTYLWLYQRPTVD